MKRILSIVITAILAGAFAFTGLAPASASPENGPLHITKECHEFTGAADSFCTITISNLTMIQSGSTVVYLAAANPVAGLLNTDIELRTENGTAFGHVILHLATGTGTVTFNGGNGWFEDFHARAAVYPLAAVGPLYYPEWAWEGSYHFSPDR